MKRVIVMLAAGALLCVQGCRTAGSGRAALDVSLLANGKVSVEGRVAPRGNLPQAVKAAGAGPSTTITVAVPGGIARAEMMNITATLRRAGYIRVIFARPRRAEVAQ